MPVPEPRQKNIHHLKFYETDNCAALAEHLAEEARVSGINKPRMKTERIFVVLVVFVVVAVAGDVVFVCRCKCRDQTPMLAPRVRAGCLWPAAQASYLRPRRAHNAQILRKPSCLSTQPSEEAQVEVWRLHKEVNNRKKELVWMQS